MTTIVPLRIATVLLFFEDVLCEHADLTVTINEYDDMIP